MSFPLTVLLQDGSDAVAGGILALFSGMWMLFWLAVVGLTIIGWWKMFEKAGQPGWVSIVPIYNIFVLGKIVGWTRGKVVMLFIPFLNIIFGIILCLDIARVFNKGNGFAVGMLLLPAIFFPMLGFDSSRYMGPDAAAVAA